MGVVTESTRSDEKPSTTVNLGVGRFKHLPSTVTAQLGEVVEHKIESIGVLPLKLVKPSQITNNSKLLLREHLQVFPFLHHLGITRAVQFLAYRAHKFAYAISRGTVPVLAPYL